MTLDSPGPKLYTQAEFDAKMAEAGARVREGEHFIREHYELRIAALVHENRELQKQLDVYRAAALSVERSGRNPI